MANIYSAKEVVNRMACILLRHGVEYVVLCPGSRNAPFLLTFSSLWGEKAITVIDERSAAFIALGIASETGKPVAIVCTSGSAILNMGPALAEAYYSQIPLIAISADRPEELHNQADSQTIRQAGALAHVVKASYDLPPENGSPEGEWYATRIVNEACNLCADANAPGPVHINVRIAEPIADTSEHPCPEPRIFTEAAVSATLPPTEISEMRRKITEEKVLMIIGGCSPAESLSQLVEFFAGLPNVAIMAERQSNAGSSGFIIKNIDGTLAYLKRKPAALLRPSLVITLGAPLVSRNIKAWLGKMQFEHWHVGTEPFVPDCFRMLSKTIRMRAAAFLRCIKESLADFEFKASAPKYGFLWHAIMSEAMIRQERFSESLTRWSDFQALNYALNRIPESWHVQFSNGTPIRYAQLFSQSPQASVACNRGVSGIDGCTSTAIGASVANAATPTLLVTGDMSAQYDLGALAAPCISPRFKMVAISNGGGAIFRFIKATREMPCLEKNLCCDVRLPLRQLAEGFGFAYLEARSLAELEKAWSALLSERTRPVILNIVTDGAASTEVLDDYFDYMSTNRLQ